MVLASDSEYIVRRVHPAEAARLVESGAARVDGRRALRLVAGPHAITAQRGSFGIVRERIAPGPSGHAGLVYSHRREVGEVD